MIKQLNVFSVGSYVVAKEWNDNFRILFESNETSGESIQDALQDLAFLDKDLSQLFAAVRQKQNSFSIEGNLINVAPECEYYKTLASGEDLNVQIPVGFSGEFRVWVKYSQNRVLTPVNILYSGNVVWNNGIADWLSAGTKLLSVFVINGTAYVKMIRTGVDNG